MIESQPCEKCWSHCLKELDVARLAASLYIRDRGYLEGRPTGSGGGAREAVDFRQPFQKLGRRISGTESGDGGK